MGRPTTNDSQKLAAVPRADLAHIDGDHSYAGALHDIGLCLAAGTRYVVVDDYDLVADVRIAVREILGARRLTALFVGDGGYRGNAVLANAGVPFPDVTPHPETTDPCR